MLKFNEKKKIRIECPVKATLKNKQYGYKELTIPSEIFTLWMQRNNNKPIKEVTLITEVPTDAPMTTYVTPFSHEINILKKVMNAAVYVTQLKVRINKSKPNKSGKQKQKATMTINKGVTLLCDDVTFILDPNLTDLGSLYYGQCTIEGLVVNQDKEKKVGKEKKLNAGGIVGDSAIVGGGDEAIGTDEYSSNVPYINQQYEYLEKKQQRKLQQDRKKENYNKYIKGSKKKGYYIVNEAKGISIGAYINKDDAKPDVDNLVLHQWNNESVESSKLNVEYYVTQKGFPHIKNFNPYYCLAEENFENLDKDVYDMTPFKNMSYDDLQEVIQDSLEYED